MPCKGNDLLSLHGNGAKETCDMSKINFSQPQMGGAKGYANLEICKGHEARVSRTVL